MIIGLTGQTGSGKSTVSKMLLKKGFCVIDCDMISRETTEKGSPVLLELARVFGEEILCKDKSLNRKKLAQIAFSTKENTEILNNITHPPIFKAIKSKISQNEGKIIVLDAPTLFESGADKLCEKIISVVADEDIRLNRILSRDNITLQQAKLRISAQSDSEFYIKRSDAVIYNNLDISELEKQVSAVLNTIGV